jgi:hypothetical protein
MHDTFGFGGPWRAGFFLYRQGIHIGPQANDPATHLFLPLNDTNHAGFADARDDLITAELSFCATKAAVR